VKPRRTGENAIALAELLPAGIGGYLRSGQRRQSLGLRLPLGLVLTLGFGCLTLWRGYLILRLECFSLGFRNLTLWLGCFLLGLRFVLGRAGSLQGA
jgi:hypothetical protein